MASSSREPWRIGGPGTSLPFVVESFLAWSLAFSCLSVSGFHYIKRLIQLRFHRQLVSSSAAADDGGGDASLPLLPLTTFSRSEMNRLSAQERLDQFEQMLQYYSGKKKDEALVEGKLYENVRNHEILRRLATLLLVKDSLPSSLRRIWPRLSEIPSSFSAFDYEISLIVPCHREDAVVVNRKLQTAWSQCHRPKQVQVVLVNSQSTDLHCAQAWGEVKVVSFDDNTGRGPCLNFGARHAKGRILVFHHSDTILPEQWDLLLCNEFSQRNPLLCAFGFSIDTTPSGLAGKPFPPGLRAIEWTANLRCKWWKLPYGDQCLSILANVFHYIGGFPNQPIMEDYELVKLLRPNISILPAKAMCSPRRWQRYGVLFVTWTNSKLVNLYERGMAPQEIYQLYYRSETATKLSPWEVEMQSILQSL